MASRQPTARAIVAVDARVRTASLRAVRRARLAFHLQPPEHIARCDLILLGFENLAQHAARRRGHLDADVIRARRAAADADAASAAGEPVRRRTLGDGQVRE